MFPSNIFCLLVFALITAALSMEEMEQNIHRLGLANNLFAANLHTKLAEVMKGNFVFSPFAITSALAMLYSAARGETSKELERVLGYEKIDDLTVFTSFQYYLHKVIGKMNPRVYSIHSVSAMIFDNSFSVLPWYISQMENVFQAYIEGANLMEESASVVDRVNKWANVKTKGTITKLADYIPSETSLFIASAAYFKGNWKVRFDSKDTKYHPFYNGGQRSNSKNVLMMHCYASFRYFENEDENFTAVELPYEGRNMSMVIYLPNELDGLPDLEAYLGSDRMMHIRSQMFYMKVHLTMPKFKIETDTSLSRALNDLGLQTIFNFKADLSGMLEHDDTLAVDDVEHKAFVEVNEKGSIAAAVTRIIMTKSMPLPIPDPSFMANHPFMFAIFDSVSNMILFMGRVNWL